MRFRLGCDIGGTFTDFTVVDTETGGVSTHKRLTTPHAPSEAIEHGIRAIMETAPDLAAQSVIVHGTTLVVNAIVERKGARTALVTTEGFRDALEIGREGRFDQYDIWLRFPAPIVPRPLRFEAAERMHVSGRVLRPLDVNHLHTLVDTVLAQNVDAVAICLLHAYRNATHERMIAGAFHACAPDLAVSLSAEVAPEAGEYERSCTTAANAYTQPLTERYLADLERRLTALGFTEELLVTLSTGGVTSVATARVFPVRILESGPAAGAVAAAQYARSLAIDRMVSFDMGGTTAKIALLAGGEIPRADSFEVDRTYRFKRGSGIPVLAPMIDLIEIGAGGGSIARITAAGTIQVGPESAGADPGPACYAGGGTLPTVTDANLLLGYIDANYFLGGTMRLDRARAEAAIRDVIAAPLGISVLEAAQGIHGVVNENMASAAKVHLAEQGADPSQCVLFAFGGGGPVHAVDLMRRMGIARAVIPPRPGVASAYGMAVAPVSYDVGRSFRTPLAELHAAELDAAFAGLETEAFARLPGSARRESVEVRRALDLRYAGQGYHLPVPWPHNANERALADLFNEAYRRLYGRAEPEQPVEVVNLRVTLTEPRPGIAGSATLPTGSPPPPRFRPAFLPMSGAMAELPVYRRATLPAGATLAGPAIIEEAETSIVVAAPAAITVDGLGCIGIAVSHGN